MSTSDRLMREVREGRDREAAVEIVHRALRQVVSNKGKVMAYNKTPSEYQMVAALLANDIDNLKESAEDFKGDADMLYRLICLTHKMKEQAINDEESRAIRYSACCLLFSSVAASNKEGD